VLLLACTFVSSDSASLPLRYVIVTFSESAPTTIPDIRHE